MTLLKVAARARISVGYLSELERDMQSNPYPNILKKLAVVYGVPPQVLMEAAGYWVKDEKPQVFSKKDRINWAFHVVLSDPEFGFFLNKGRTRFMSLEQKIKLIEAYQALTGKRLLA